jgi:hypothetical protein
MAGDFDPRDLDSREPDDGIRDRDDQCLVLARGPASPREDSLDEDARDRNDDWLEERDRGSRHRDDNRDVDPRDVFSRDLELPRDRDRELVEN